MSTLSSICLPNFWPTVYLRTQDQHGCCQAATCRTCTSVQIEKVSPPPHDCVPTVHCRHCRPARLCSLPGGWQQQLALSSQYALTHIQPASALGCPLPSPPPQMLVRLLLQPCNIPPYPRTAHVC